MRLEFQPLVGAELVQEILLHGAIPLSLFVVHNLRPVVT